MKTLSQILEVYEAHSYKEKKIKNFRNPFFLLEKTKNTSNNGRRGEKCKWN
jgi:hypothetical protein